MVGTDRISALCGGQSEPARQFNVKESCEIPENEPSLLLLLIFCPLLQHGIPFKSGNGNSKESPCKGLSRYTLYSHKCDLQ